MPIEVKRQVWESDLEMFRKRVYVEMYGLITDEIQVLIVEQVSAESNCYFTD